MVGRVLTTFQGPIIRHLCPSQAFFRSMRMTRWTSLSSSTWAFGCFTPANILYLAVGHTGFQTECNCDRKKKKSSWLRRYKTSILLGRSGTCCSTYRENKRTISLAVCALRAQIRLFFPPIVTPNLIFSFLSKQTTQSDFFFFCPPCRTYNASDVQPQIVKGRTQVGYSRWDLVLRVPFNSSSERHNPPRNKMWFTLSWPRRGFHHSVTVRMPTRSMVHETASFYWHGIQSVPPGYMSLALEWGPPITALPAPAHILLPNPF